jgi:hypothetical protein
MTAVAFADLALPDLAAVEERAAGWDGVEVLAGARTRERADLWVLGERARLPAVATAECFAAAPLGDRGDGAQTPTLALVVAFAPPGAAAVRELDRFYEEEHSPLLLEIPGWLRIRRFALAGDGAWTRLAVHDLADSSVFADPRFAATQETDWYRRLFAQAWFADAGRRPVRRLR